MSCRCRLWAITVCVQRIEGDQIPTLPLLKWNFKDSTNEGLLIISYDQMNTG